MRQHRLRKGRPTVYFRRIAIAGSILAARRAGIQEAATQIDAISAETPMIVTGSSGATP